MQTEKEQVALTSILASALLTLAKAVVGIMTGSLAILSEAGHSLIDLGATVMTYVAVRMSGKPADAEHHYGHGKIESISALAETALLFLLSGVVIFEAGRRLISHEMPQVEATLWAFGVIVVSIVVDFFRARALSRTAQATSSHALEGDALHFSSDLWASLAVLVGLAGVRFGLPWADTAAALVVAATPRELRRGPSDVPRAEGSERRFAHLYFLDSDPRESFTDLFAEHVAELEKAGLGRVQLASPFLTTIPGTDTYTDQLW
jgi:divalent metal cation (Fe/Co/Zn/Cd) transporter